MTRERSLKLKEEKSFLVGGGGGRGGEEGGGGGSPPGKGKVGYATASQAGGGVNGKVIESNRISL